jgi:hypothetical protein
MPFFRGFTYGIDKEPRQTFPEEEALSIVHFQTFSELLTT